MTIHELNVETSLLHGRFNPDRAPVLTIEPGDTVRYRTLQAGWSDDPVWRGGGERVRWSANEGVPTDGHALTGPVAINGAEPGMTLSIRIDQMHPGSWGATTSGGWDAHVNRWFKLTDASQQVVMNWSLDWDQETATGTGTSDTGYKVPLKPFLGVIGMPPAEPGWHKTSPPRKSGGNLDCKELVVGSTLYLPIALAGGLVSVGDGHALQSDGEVSGTAIECPMDRVEITYDLMPEQLLPGPWAETPAGTITFGFDEDLNKAALKALAAMTDLLGIRYGMSRQEALIMASLVVDLRITQIVNGVQGAHAVLPPDAIHKQVT